MKYFFDTSSLVKIYHKEVGSDSTLAIFNSTANEIFISELAKIEFLSTIYKKLRTQELSQEILVAIRSALNKHLANRISTIPLTSAIMEMAIKIITRHAKDKHIFTLDAIQFAAFLELSNDAVFVCSDHKFILFLKQLPVNLLEI